MYKENSCDLYLPELKFCFCPKTFIFFYFVGGQKVFFKKTTSFGFPTPFHDLEKTNHQIPRQGNERADGRMNSSYSIDGLRKTYFEANVPFLYP